MSERVNERREPVSAAHEERELKFAGVELPQLRDRLLELQAERLAPPAFEDNWIFDRGKGELQREGGSIPVVNTFSSVLEAPVLLMGFGLPDDRLHSPNEKMSIPQFYDGIRCVVRLLDRIGDISAEIAA